jgi:DNA-binding response OmpR family regulator
LYARFAVIRVVLLTDRTPAQVLPGAPPLLLDLKTEHLSVATVAEALALGPDAVLVDAAENPGQGHAVLHALRERGPRIPVLVVVERRDVDRFPWEEVADDVIFPGAPEGEIRLRFALARRRTGTGEETAIRLGPIVLDPSTYRVSLEGTPLDLTFKEFELLRYLAERRGRVFTRPALLREVWGYDFYGGTRTVDVHVRRLRSKLGPAHEGLVETVRGVGYRAADV